ncbi:MAG: stage V sporulation protein AC [Firmicutes bacterium]|jgi:stage V sporulation protein AC|nr:stage V sporulation protein AC [Bacillota bacterium]HPU00302.1 stage V sporulation protein AC [Bacillota bacterium]
MAAVPEELNITPEEYRELVKKERPAPPLWRNALCAFASGGAISLLGQAIQNGFIALGFKPEDASNPTVAVVILLASLLTGLGLFDRLARFAGAGMAVPVTGFANSVTSAALEFKKEGLVLGVGAKMFSLAGTVILFGVITAFVAGLISAIF